MSSVIELDMSVRDYECDIQGVVNNAVYQNYLEHARHLFLKKNQIDFAALAENDINLMVIRAELDYKGSLKSGDHFTITTRMERKSRLKFAFIQTIKIHSLDKIMLKAEIIGVALNAQGKPFLLADLGKLLS